MIKIPQKQLDYLLKHGEVRIFVPRPSPQAAKRPPLDWMAENLVCAIGGGPKDPAYRVKISYWNRVTADGVNGISYGTRQRVSFSCRRPSESFWQMAAYGSQEDMATWFREVETWGLKGLLDAWTIVLRLPTVTTAISEPMLKPAIGSKEGGDE